jgi:hypothetical protein
MWTTAGAMALQFFCLAPILAGGRPRPARGPSGPAALDGGGGEQRAAAPEQPPEREGGGDGV